MRFAREEFDTMVQELLYSGTGRSDALARIVETTLRPAVRFWCYKDLDLCGRESDEDIMQEVHLRLMMTTVSHFLLRDGIEGPYNNDPEGFEDWIYKVAYNIKRDFANRVRGGDFKNTELKEGYDGKTTTVHGNTEEELLRIERLKEAFSIVLDSDVSVYKVLTWLAEFVFILEHNVPKIQANDLILTAFENKTLFEMYDMLLCAAQNIPWIEVTEEQHERISAALRKKHHGDVLYGEIKYRDFFIKQNGKPSGKKSVSDWMNRINGKIRSEEEAPPSGREKSGSEDQGREEERRREDGASDG